MFQVFGQNMQISAIEEILLCKSTFSTGEQTLFKVIAQKYINKFGMAYLFKKSY